MRNDACPTQVMPSSPFLIFGNNGSPPLPARLVKSDGMSTLVRKLRLCQSELGRKPTWVALVAPPFSGDWMTFRWLRLKGIGTLGEAYKLGIVTQNLSGR